ncbi:MAG: hypothetical protein WEK74_06965, partial [Hydrogenophaga sp.]
MNQLQVSCAKIQPAKRALRALKETALLPYLDFEKYAYSEEMQLLLEGSIQQALSMQGTSLAIGIYEIVSS